MPNVGAVVLDFAGGAVAVEHGKAQEAGESAGEGVGVVALLRQEGIIPEPSV
jgi:hypothetical protein